MARTVWRAPRVRTALPATTLAVFFLLAASAGAATRWFPASEASRCLLSIPLKGLEPDSVRAARLTSAGAAGRPRGKRSTVRYSRPISAARVSRAARAGVLRLRLGRERCPDFLRDARLAVLTSPSRPAAEVRAETSAPAAPQDLRAAAGDGTVTLTWASGGNARFYDVLRNGGWVAFVGAPATRFEDDDLTNGTTYAYEVRARGSDSTYSASRVSATPRASAPTLAPSTLSPAELVLAPPVAPVAPAATAPAPTLGTSCSSALANLRAGSGPGACWRPYAPTSPFNRAIPANPKTVSNSAAIVRRTLGMGRPGKVGTVPWRREYGWSKPTYYSTSTDPQFTLDCTGVGTPGSGGGNCQPGLSGLRIRIPDAAKPEGYLSGDAYQDRHMTVIDPSSGFEYSFWHVTRKPAGGGTLQFSGGARIPIGGDGRNSGATAAGFGNTAGLIRAQEMQAEEIGHALFMVAGCVRGRVYPAVGDASQCSDGTNAPANGQHFQYDATPAEIDAMNVPVWKKVMLKAMARYGLFVGDTGGTAFGHFESGGTYESFGMPDRMAEYVRSQPGSGEWVDENGEKHHILGDLGAGVNWEGKLRVIDPCVSQGTC